MRVTFYARTDPGRVRTRNEDAYAVSDEDGFCVLCDGMGGHAAGDVAAGLAVDVLASRVKSAIPRPTLGPRTRAEMVRVRAALPKLVAEWLREANAAVYERGRQHPPEEGARRMGTTLAFLCVVGDFAVVANVGDSRIYLAREGRIALLTRDHTVLSADLPFARQRLRKRKYVTKALGTKPAVEPDVQTLHVRDGDHFVLCSDGLTDVVKDIEILGALQARAPRLETVPDALVDLANARGGRDNVTVVVARIDRGVSVASSSSSSEDLAAPPDFDPPPPHED